MSNPGVTLIEKITSSAPFQLQLDVSNAVAGDCDSGCRGFEPRFSPPYLLGFQPNTQLKISQKKVLFRVLLQALLEELILLESNDLI